MLSYTLARWPLVSVCQSKRQFDDKNKYALKTEKGPSCCDGWSSAKHTGGKLKNMDLS